MFRKFVIVFACLCGVAFGFKESFYSDKGFCFANKINIEICSSYAFFENIFNNLDSIDIL